MSRVLRAATAVTFLALSVMPASADIPPDPADPTSPTGVALILALLAGGVGYFFYRRRRK